MSHFKYLIDSPWWDNENVKSINLMVFRIFSYDRFNIDIKIKINEQVQLRSMPMIYDANATKSTNYDLNKVQILN